MNMVKLMRWKSNIVIVGKYSRYVRVPLDWINSHELLPGDQVEISLNADGSLRLEPVKQRGSHVD